MQRAHGSFIAKLRDGQGCTSPVTVASAATVDIGGQTSYFVEVTGTTTITSFGTTYNGPRYVRFQGALTLTYNATTLNIYGGASVTTSANYMVVAIPNAALNGWNVFPIGGAGSSTDYLNTTRIDVASSATTDLTSLAPNTRNINITGTTTITAFTVAIGQTYFVRFNAALTLTNNASIVTQTGANITTTAGDTCILRATAANTVEVLSYSYAAIVPDLSITPAKLSQKSTLGTSVATTSGTSIDFTSIPSWVKRVTIMFDGVSTNGTSNPLIQIGNSGGIQATSYKASSSLITTGVSTTNYTTGFGIATALASNTLNGSLVLTLMDSSTAKWTISGVLNTEANTLTATVAGVKALSSLTLDRIRLTTVGGTDTFDAGSINILYE